MFTETLLICLFAAFTVIIPASAEKKYNNQSELIDDMLDNMFQCMQELNMNPDVCTEMLMKDKDLNDKKYDSCKCLGPCTAKRMGTMNPETGKWNWARFNELSELIDNEMLKSEADILKKNCYDDVNTHCAAGYAFMKCALEHSPMAKDMVKNYLATKENAQNEDEATE